MNARDFAPGRLVGGGYTIQTRLGGSAWATTYSALAVPRREVAIKIFSQAVSDRPDILGALEGCDALVGSLTHGVLHAVATGRDATSGFYYRVVPFSAHPSLEQLTELCPLAIDELVPFLRNVARVLDAAHAKGLVHGALKPSNVFVGPGPNHSIELADFGANTCRGAWRTPPSDGLAWLAPEQIGGVRPPSLGGPATDVFALGLLAFYALTRSTLRGPQDGAHTAASLQAHEVGVRIPGSLDGVFAKALAPNPADRYPTPGALVAAFDVALRVPEGEVTALSRAAARTPLDAPSGASPLVADARPSRPGSNRRRLWLGLGAAAVALGVASVIGLVTLSRARPLAASPAPSSSVARSTAAALGTATPSNPAALGAPVVGATGAPLAPAPAPVPGPVPTPTVTPETVAAKPTEPTEASPPKSAGKSAKNVTELVVECQPSCDMVKVDGKTVREFPFEVTPGVHAVGVARRGFLGDYRKITVERGTRRAITFRLLTAPAKKKR